MDKRYTNQPPPPPHPPYPLPHRHAHLATNDPAQLYIHTLFKSMSIFLQFSYQETPLKYFAMFRKEDGTCICTEFIDWSTYPAGPVSLRRAVIRPGTNKARWAT